MGLEVIFPVVFDRSIKLTVHLQHTIMTDLVTTQESGPFSNHAPQFVLVTVCDYFTFTKLNCNA